jgi:hypothetical protein
MSENGCWQCRGHESMKDDCDQCGVSGFFKYHACFVTSSFLPCELNRCNPPVNGWNELGPSCVRSIRVKNFIAESCIRAFVSAVPEDVLIFHTNTICWQEWVYE